MPLVVHATADSELPGDQVTNLIAQLQSNSEGAVETSVVDGGHYVFLRPCTPAELATVPAICEDADGIDRAAMHTELSTQVVSFIQS